MVCGGFGKHAHSLGIMSTLRNGENVPLPTDGNKSMFSQRADRGIKNSNAPRVRELVNKVVGRGGDCG